MVESSKVSTVGGDLNDFNRNEAGEISPTIENFFRYCSERKLMAVRCEQCETIQLPPRPFCSKCYSSNLEWFKLKGKGKLLTYSIVHVPPPQFETMAPYAVGVVKLEEGVNLPGIIKLKDMKNLNIDMELIVDFETLPFESWLGRTRYYFKEP